MWQANERKQRFIEAALSGDRSIRRLEDASSQSNQFAMAKALASGDQRLIQKAGLDAEIARLERLRAAHLDNQLSIRQTVEGAQHDRRCGCASSVASAATLPAANPRGASSSP